MGSSSTNSDGGSATPTTVAVAVRGGSSCERAVRWAIANLIPHAHRFILVHVMPPITSIPIPSGNNMPIGQMDADVVAMYTQDMKLKCSEIFQPFKRLCKTREMETLILDDQNPAPALLRFISESDCKILVLGSSSSNYISRKLKGPDVPSTVQKFAPNTCDIYIVSRHKLLTKFSSPSTAGTSIEHRMFTPAKHGEGASTIDSNMSPLHSTSNSKVNKTLEASSSGDLSDSYSQPCEYGGSSICSVVEDHRNFENRTLEIQMVKEHDFMSYAVVEDNEERNHQNFENRTLEIRTVKEHDFISSSKDAKQLELEAERERLRLELQSTLAMYDRACDNLAHVQNKVQSLSSECIEETRRVNVVLEREETLRKIAAEEKAKHLEAMKEVEVAKQLLSKEVHDRQRAELAALKESSERLTLIDTLLTIDKRYRRYTRYEIEVATEFFSEAKKIGEGGYGKVYRCSLNHTPVAIKVIHQDTSERKEEFLREVEVLSQLRHPHLVLLLGACPEIRCLVYEDMENGSLEEHLLCNEGTTPLPWFFRFRIVFEVACALSFLHGSKPEPIVHRDLKPGNILLDKNFVSKIGDVGLAKLMADVVPDNVTEYRDSLLAGTLYYMDPEYQRTGTVRPKSDVYALGIIILQLLTARHPNGLLTTVENAINNGSFADMLDKSITDWPLAASEELARIALKCSRLRCRDRPDLEYEVMPVLKKLSDMADASVQLKQDFIYAPSHYFCPILQDIMDDPHIAADGFTYEYIAIKAWLEKHSISPVTRLKFPHSTLTPNHTLRSAIQEWKRCSTF